MEEIFKPITALKGKYEVSNLGRIKSVTRNTASRWGKTKTSPSKMLKLETTNRGYIRFGGSIDGKKVRMLVHRAVAMEFIPNPLNSPCVNHKDNVRSNNVASNLEWATYQENSDYAASQGRFWHPSGKEHPSSKITHCPQGHPYEGGNLFWYGPRRSYRGCRQCHRDAFKRYVQRHRMSEVMSKEQS